VSEYDRRLAVAIEAARNVGAARGEAPDLAAVRAAVLAGLDTAELVAVVVRGLAGDRDAKEALSILLLRLTAELQDLEANARVIEGASQPGKAESPGLDLIELQELGGQAPAK
jgi:hypothetical protein